MVNEVAESCATPAQDLMNIITPAINSQNELPSGQGEEMKEADESSTMRNLQSW